MTQSSERQKKQPLPVPPLIPQTKPQGTTDMSDESTRISANSPFPSLQKGNIPPLKNKIPTEGFDLPDFDDDDDDDFKPEDATQVNLDAGVPPLGKRPPLSPPPLTPKGIPTVPLGAKRTLTPPPLTSKGKPGETDVRRGTPMARPPLTPPPFDRGTSPGVSPLRTGPQGGIRPSAPSRAAGQPPLSDLVKLAYDNGYSDVHLGVGETPRMRDRGEMVILDQYPEIDLNTFMSWLREILREEEIQKFKKELEFDGATQYDFARVRINVFDALNGPAVVLRLIPLKILSMEQLRLPPIFRDVCDAHKGLILITGPTGSGKSTTLAAMIDHINSEQAKHIITIEDPVEFVHKSRRALIKQREVGMNTLKFDNALKAALREDPDIILVGEMRDKETVNTALKAAQTGHLVMGTLHTNSAIKTLERVFTLYTAEEQVAIRSALAESLVAIIAQGLCRTTDGKRAAYHDILINTETVKDYILANKYEEIGMLMTDGEFDGMMTMNKSLFNLYQDGRITEETALERSPTRNEMAMMLRGRV